MRQFDEKPLPHGFILAVFQPFFEELRRMEFRISHPRLIESVNLADLDRRKREERERAKLRSMSLEGPFDH